MDLYLFPKSNKYLFTGRENFPVNILKIVNMNSKRIVKIIVILIIAAIAILLVVHPKETARGFKEGYEAVVG